MDHAVQAGIVLVVWHLRSSSAVQAGAAVEAD
jgi:hypothetical protein